MNDLLAKAGAAFLAPAPAARPAVDAPPPDLVGVLASARDLGPVAGGVAAELRRRHRSRAALVCSPAAAAGPRPANRAARALAGRLAARELRVVAAGSTCHVELPEDPEAAVRDAWRAVTAAAGHPAVVALGERTQEADALLAEADLLVLAPPPEAAVAELALESLRALGPPALHVAPPAGVVARRLASLSLTAIPLRAEVPA